MNIEEKLEIEHSHPYVGFGFGAIQSGLFLYEANRANPKRKLAVAEVVPEIVTAIRKSGGVYQLNIAHHDHLEIAEVENVEIWNPEDESERINLIEMIAAASEIGTALPSVDFYDRNATKGVSRILAEGLIKKIEIGGPPVIVYTAENNNQAAEILEDHVFSYIPEDKKALAREKTQYINTVIGKMSQVINGREEIAEYGLSPITADLERAFLVESFNHIQISQIENTAVFQRSLTIFEEKRDLLPFEEAKLFGHNAIHSLIGYLCAMLGVKTISEIPSDSGIRTFAENAFLFESGSALIRKYDGTDVLFTKEGFEQYAKNLIERMMNPILNDATNRVIRDTSRKLGWNDRLIGTIRLALENGVYPERFLVGTLAAIYSLDRSLLDDPKIISKILNPIWDENHIRGEGDEERRTIISYLEKQILILKKWMGSGFRNLNTYISR